MMSLLILTEISGVETIHAQKGDDVLTITTNDTEAVFGGLGTDRVTLTDGAGNSALKFTEEGTGAEGLDEVMLSDTNAATLGIFGVEVALGGTGNDHIHSSIKLFDLTSILIDGGLGNDSLLRGGGGADTIFGGDGVDRLEGQDGNDLLEGGAGAGLASWR